MTESNIKVNNLLEMLTLLYPSFSNDAEENERQRNVFYERNCLLEKLDYAALNLRPIYKLSSEEEKNYLAYLITLRLKSLFYEVGEYERAVNLCRRMVYF